VIIAVVIVGIVLYLVEPMFQQREQGLLLERYRTQIDKAANQATGLQGVETPATAPSFGSAVGIIEIGALGMQTVVTEGVDSSATRVGPGHVPGTAAPGQPGNAVIVGRRSMFGGPFGGIASLAVGDQIVVSTTQGRTLYEVTDVGAVKLTGATAPAEAPVVAQPTTSTTSTTVPTDAAATDVTTATTVAETPPTDPNDAATETSVAAAVTTTTEAPVIESSLTGSIPLDSLYGTSKDDRLTLVTSASAFPWNAAEANVAVAVMIGKPFPPTPQNGRSARQAGNTGDSSRWPITMLSFLFLAAAVAGAVVLYRRSSPRVAYLLTVPPLLAFAILASESLSLLLPAWA
jgi:LPXTG-site transpeptidase (sortase) family protein